MKMPTAVFLLLLLLSATTNLHSSAAPIPGLDSFLTQQSRIDPKSTNDPFQSLPSSLKKFLSSSSAAPLHIPSLISSLLSLSVPIPLHIRLVGLNFSSSSLSLLTSFLQSSVTSSHFHLISSSSSHHSLSIGHSLHLDVSLSPSSLSSTLSTALSSALSSTPSSLRSPLLSIPYSTVDSIISRHFDSEKTDNSVYVYILNLGVTPKQPYAYSYSHSESSAGYTNCLGTLWTGNKRYLWIDLGAGPVDYGPALSGDGVLPRGEFHPLAAAHGRPKSEKTLLADLASLIYSAYQVLVVPPLRIPVHFENTLTVELIHIHASENVDSSGLDWNEIEKSFRNEANDGELLFGNQSLEFKRYSVNYEECSICSFAVSRSINSFTSRFLFDNYTLIVSEYLDSKRLHQILSDSAEEFRRVAGLPEEEFGSRVLPVYVFDLDYHTILLLDRYHQSIAFRDMVIAVRTRTAQTVSDYSCNGRHVFTRTRELQRPLVGSILQSMWGVSPTHLLWSPTHNSTLVDYTWTVGQTPFGPFSEVMSLSFVQKDAARRNFLLTSLNYSLTSAIDVLESIDAHGGVRNLLKQKQHVEFIQRWHLFRYKLDKAVSALSHFDFEMAFYYIKSSDHDLYAIHDLVYTSSQEIEASLVCFKDPPFPWAALSFSAVGFLALSYVYAKRDKLFRNKRKQF
ncbi:hypothetical protein ERO13_A09G022300v2 [Gossypium hirsutum]|uniref:DUF7906 domain-containing protein n=2 Tax=Gossypium TaxID=3633 RepID=A0A1U8I3W5_GOSHI|nr:uncharacterized protein LOC107892368 [Gossypium hirsutum]KAG4182080.1 hypothetical protein ERO13_A09G022300v2 [Gossypium hirsutum]TYI08815.1 hypothetical protein ES332_A09G028300v1 [Gossypium tomentosum]